MFGWLPVLAIRSVRLPNACNKPNWSESRPILQLMALSYKDKIQHERDITTTHFTAAERNRRVTGVYIQTRDFNYAKVSRWPDNILVGDSYECSVLRVGSSSWLPQASPTDESRKQLKTVAVACRIKQSKRRVNRQTKACTSPTSSLPTTNQEKTLTLCPCQSLPI